MLKARTMEESIALAAANRRSTELRQEEREELAKMIRSEITEAWNKGQR